MEVLVRLRSRYRYDFRLICHSSLDNPVQLCLKHVWKRRCHCAVLVSEAQFVRSQVMASQSDRNSDCKAPDQI